MLHPQLYVRNSVLCWTKRSSVDQVDKQNDKELLLTQHANLSSSKFLRLLGVVTSMVSHYCRRVRCRWHKRPLFLPFLRKNWLVLEASSRLRLLLFRSRLSWFTDSAIFAPKSPRSILHLQTLVITIYRDLGVASRWIQGIFLYVKTFDN